ncbi:calpain-A-like [Protopterus annectens]|uniref:calpain-A-like n=1 Tax=Protopterus annectens TaxID=7888 RepID=UPI001CF96E38|nr:calpain-A-like [Protopterus annectens]
MPYYGIFRFWFWQFGSWVEILVDDFLPTRNGNLIYARSEAGNEFWPSLLEKAYAKLHGSYKAIEGGWTIDALTDLTGGVGEMYKLRDFQDRLEELYNHLASAFRKNAFIACGTGKQTDGPDSEKQDGLVAGHAYSITAVNKLTTPRGSVPLVRILNPWGVGEIIEWTGDWSDTSPLWDDIPVWTRESFGFTKKDDGEFWMGFEDFSKRFANVTVLTLGPDFDSDGCVDAGYLKEEKGQWVTGTNAGGSRNNIELYAENPQYPFTITESDVMSNGEDDGEDGICFMLVCLLQKYRRNDRKLGTTLKPIALQIYKSEDPFEPLTTSQFTCESEVAGSGPYVAQRSINLHCQLYPGDYIIIPSTYSANTDGAYMLRIFTESEIEFHSGHRIVSC